MSEKGNWSVAGLVVGVFRRATLFIYGRPLVTSRNQLSLPRSLACLDSTLQVATAFYLR